jgi:hypothetical protein
VVDLVDTMNLHRHHNTLDIAVGRQQTQADSKTPPEDSSHSPTWVAFACQAESRPALKGPTRQRGPERVAKQTVQTQFLAPTASAHSTSEHGTTTAMDAWTTGNSHTTDIDPLDNIAIHIALIRCFRDLVDKQHAATERAATRVEE